MTEGARRTIVVSHAARSGRDRYFSRGRGRSRLPSQSASANAKQSIAQRAEDGRARAAKVRNIRTGGEYATSARRAAL